MTECKLSLPTETSGVLLADWVETVLFVERRRKLSRTELRSRLHSAYLDEGEGVDVAVDLALQEVDRRGVVGGAAYPFKVERSGVAVNEAVDHVKYGFLLLASTSDGFRTQKDFGEVNRLLDLLAMEGLKAYLGEAGRGVRFAHPSSDGRPKAFTKALELSPNPLMRPLRNP